MQSADSTLKYAKPKTLRLIRFPSGTYDEWTPKEAAIMEAHAATWASEFVKDFDAQETAIRLGFEEDEVKTAVKRYSNHWLVKAYIQQIQERFLEENIATKDRLVAATYRDSVDFSRWADSKARTTAQKTLTTLLGLDTKERRITVEGGIGSDGLRGGVMILPATLSQSEWAEKASTSQRQLKEEVRK